MSYDDRFTVEEFDADGLFLNCTGKSTEELSQEIASQGFTLMHDVYMCFNDSDYEKIKCEISSGVSTEIEEFNFPDQGYLCNANSFYETFDALGLPENHKNFLLWKLGYNANPEFVELIMNFEDVSTTDITSNRLHLVKNYDLHKIWILRRGGDGTLNSIVSHTFYTKKA